MSSGPSAPGPRIVCRPIRASVNSSTASGVSTPPARVARAYASVWSSPGTHVNWNARRVTASCSRSTHGSEPHRFTATEGVRPQCVGVARQQLGDGRAMTTLGNVARVRPPGDGLRMHAEPIGEALGGVTRFGECCDKGVIHAVPSPEQKGCAKEIT